MFSLDHLLEDLHPSQKVSRWKRALLSKLVYEKDFQRLEQLYPHLKGVDLIDQVIDDFNIRCEYSHGDLENIPSDGAAVIVANHPIGSLDALALLQAVFKVRRDVKVMTTPLLSYLKPLRNLFISVDNINKKTDRRQIQRVMSHLETQGALIIFPAGEVSRLRLSGIQDGEWLTGFLRLATKFNTPIVPVHIDAHNSPLFYAASLLYQPLSSLLLIRELFSHNNSIIKLKIGRQILPSDWLNVNKNSRQLAQHFREHTYRLKISKAGLFNTEAPIALAENRALLRKALSVCEVLGNTPDNKTIYLYRRENDIDSPILRELGRLREIAFRAVGEGSGKRRDLDKYDDDYNHLILWDDAELEIVGAYRFVATEKQISEKGIESIYTSIFFDYQANMKLILNQGIELGRSFIQPRYWGKRGLDYLWLGIGAYLAKYPQYRYLFGPVSISGNMPRAGLDLLVTFYRLYFSQKAPSAKSRVPYPDSLPQALAQFCGDNYVEDLKKLKNLLNNLNCAIPTLYKQYAELCEPGGVQFLDFGIDTEFNSIDGLVLVDITKLKPSRYQRYIAVHKQKDIT